MDKENKNNGKKKLIITMAVALILLVGVTVSYGYIAILGNSKNQEVSVGTGDIHLVFDDADTESVNANLKLGQSITKTFKIENKGTKPGKVQINWKNLINTYNSRSLSYTLESSNSKTSGYTTVETIRENVPVSTEAKDVPLSKELTIPVSSAPIYYRVIITFNNLSDVDQSGDVNATLTTQFSLTEPENISKKVIAVLDGNVKNGNIDFNKPSPSNEYGIKKIQEEKFDVRSTNAEKYIFYADSYDFNINTGKFMLVNPKIGKYSEIYSSLSEKYIRHQFFTPETYDVTNIEEISSEEIESATSNLGNIRFVTKATLNDYKYTLYEGSKKYIESKNFSTSDSTDMTSYANNVIFYADDYTFDGINFELSNPKSCKYSECYASLIGKYVINEIKENTTIGPWITKIIDASLDNITVQYIMYDDIGETYDYSTQGVYMTEDDYGNSYYYRGNPANNYVKFANFTWRIIRINGDGSVRLIYKNNSANEGNSIGYANYLGADVKYMGYMFGGSSETAASTSIKDAIENKYSSAVKKLLDTWYENNLLTYSEYISDTLFCNDRAITKEGTGNENTYFAAYNRFNLMNHDSAPTLKCSQKNDRFTVDDTTVGNGDLTYPIALHTADEEAFAGLVPTGNDSIETLLRQNNFMGEYYRNNTLTPYYYNKNYRVYFTHLLDIANFYLATSGSYGNSPVINIKPEYALKMVGKGSESDPFIIPGVN